MEGTAGSGAGFGSGAGGLGDWVNASSEACASSRSPFFRRRMSQGQDRHLKKTRIPSLP